MAVGSMCCRRLDVDRQADRPKVLVLRADCYTVTDGRSGFTAVATVEGEEDLLRIGEGLFDGFSRRHTWTITRSSVSTK